VIEELLEYHEVAHISGRCIASCPFCEAQRRGISVYAVVLEDCE
jgi:hypothetical protein